MDQTMLQMMRLGQQGFSCAQIMVLLALELRGESNPALVRSLAGLAYGCGSGAGACGALTGGACVLGLYAGKGQAGEEESPQLLVMLQELSDWFVAKAGDPGGAVTCAALTGEAGPAAARQKCGLLVAETHAKVVELLLAHDFELGV